MPCRRAHIEKPVRDRCATRLRQFGSLPATGMTGRLGWLAAVLLMIGSNTILAQPFANEVLITEFMASNTNALADEDGDFSDWIEIQNISLPSVDLDGWYLTDDAGELTKWRLPSVLLQRGESIVVFASDKNRALPNAQLHTNFKLGAEGEFLGLVKPDGITLAHAYAPAFPQQYSDLSYGLPQNALDFASVGDQANYLVPTAGDAAIGTTWTESTFDDSSWTAGSLGMGFETSSVSSLQVKVVRSNIPLQNLATAEGVLDDPATHISVTEGTAQVVNFLNTGSGGHYGNSATFPGMTILTNVDDFVVEVTGTVLIPQAGQWTFGVTSDDGFGLELSRNPFEYSAAFPGLRGAGDTLAVFQLPEAGLYALRLVYFDRTGSSMLELFAAPGSFSTFDAASFDLVGDVASGGLQLSGFGNDLQTDLETEMLNINTSLWLRRPFFAAAPSALAQLFMDVNYEDGFVAFLNGQEILSRNAPSPLEWNSASASDLPLVSAQEGERIDLTSAIPFLQTGANLLAIHAFNDSIADADFVIVPRLSAVEDTNPNAAGRYFAEFTPGAYNNQGFPGVSASVQFSLNDATFTDVLSLVITSSAPGATIRYTVDGTDPTETNGIIYTTPVDITTSVQIRARAFEAGLAPGPLGRRLFTKLNPDALAFSSNLPLVVVDTFGRATTQSWYTVALTAIIDTTGGLANMTDSAGFIGSTGLKIRGSSSTSFPKKQYALETWDVDNKDVDVSLLGFPANSDWILYGPYTDKSLMRDFLAYRWSNDIGRYAVRTRYVEVFFDENGGGVSQADYAGVYILQEKIKQGPHRVNIAELGPDDNTAPAVTGGYLIKKDRLDPGDTGFLTSTGQRLAYVYPKETEITTAQATYLKGFFDTFEAALYGPDFADPVLGYPAFIDADSFIDHHIMVEMTKNIDGYRLSTFMFKDRNGKLNMGPVWDYNLTLGNANYLDGWLPTGWYYPLLTSADYPWWGRLFQDPEFQLRYADRWHQLRRDTFQTSELVADIDEIAALLEPAQQRNYVRWPILGIYIWPNFFIGLTYAEEIAWMKQWLADRLVWMDSQLSPPPTYNQQGGVIAPPFELTISANSGTVYYTLDGSDPRLTGGAISPSALVYSTPIPLTHDSQVRARSFDSVTWSAENNATFDVLPIAYLNEVLAGNTLINADELGEFDPWIELYNASTATVDLGGYFLTDDPLEPTKWMIPPNTIMCGKTWLLFWADNETGQGPLHTNFALSLSGGLVQLSDPSGVAIETLTYPPLAVNAAFGRFPDADFQLQVFSVPSPQAANNAAGAYVFLNEYNAVAPGNFLGGTGTDVFWGRILGNGGDWFELVVATDHADLRGWQLLVSDDTGGGSQTIQTLTLTQHSLWSDVRAGTIITISEDLPTDVSFDPAAGDWWINVRASAAGDGNYISQQGFDVSQRNWQLTIKNAQGVPRFGPSGEGINPASGIGSDEVFKLEENATALITPQSNYRDGTSSTFGAPNLWSAGTVSQDMSALRGLVLTNCSTAAQCDDLNPCTTDDCVASLCTHDSNVLPCSDGNPCTIDDTCSAGGCSGAILAGCCHVDCDCNDGNSCTADACINNLCTTVPDQEGLSCDDGAACTVVDVCLNGTCAGVPTDCSALNDACNLGTCIPATGDCTPMPVNEGATCDDGDICTAVDTCANGNCAGSSVISCDDANDCTTDGCDPLLGCQFIDAVAGAACGDPTESPCNHADSCDGMGGCLSNIEVDGTSCSDGDACTVNDSCTSETCAGVPTDCSALNDACNLGTCLPGTGECAPLPANEGATCDDGDICTTVDTCANGTCAGSSVISCDDANDCTTDACDPLLGCQFIDAVAGAACGDPTESPCDHADSCDGMGGCLSNIEVDGSSCSDGDACTVNDSCTSGSCVAGIPLDCDDGNVCTTDSCFPVGGCQYVTNTTACDDGQFCTMMDVCLDGSCTGSGSPCTAGFFCEEVSDSCLPTAEPPLTLGAGARYLTATPPPGLNSVALRVESSELTCLPQYIDMQGLLVDTPVFQTSEEWGTVLVGDREIIPFTTYEVRSDVRLPAEPENLSLPTTATTWHYGDGNDSGSVDVFDIVCVLDGFQSLFGQCSLFSTDQMGTAPDRLINIFDIIAVLDAFGGMSYPETDPCSPGRDPGAPASIVAMAAVRLVPVQRSAQPGGQVVVDVYFDGEAQLRGYQLSLSARISGGDTNLAMVDAWVDPTRDDLAFAGDPHYFAVDHVRGRIAAGLVGNPRLISSGAYLGTFVYQIPAQAAGHLRVSLSTHDDVLFLRSTTVSLPVKINKPLIVPITAKAIRAPSRIR